MRLERRFQLQRNLVFRLDPGIRINQMSYAERQLIAIAKALRRRCKVVILDEHTAALEVREVGVVGEPGRNREVVQKPITAQVGTDVAD